MTYRQEEFIIIEFIVNPLNKFIIFIIIAFILLKMPVIGKYIAVINTLIHEVGHALVAMFTFGKVEKIELFANTSGTAWSSSRFWIGRVLTSLAGYPFASATSYLFLYLIINQKYIYVLGILLIMLVFSFILWVRNLYGFFWIITFLVFMNGLIIYDNATLTYNILLFITTIIFMESISSAFDIFKLSFTQPTKAGDATSLWKSIIFAPSPIWGTFFFVQSLLFGYLGIRLFI